MHKYRTNNYKIRDNISYFFNKIKQVIELNKFSAQCVKRNKNRINQKILFNTNYKKNYHILKICNTVLYY